MLLFALACTGASTVKPDESATPDTAQPSDDSAPVDTVVDADGDGQSEADGDCDDANPDAYTGAEEIWYDGIDEACDGGDDDDADGDGSPSPDDCDDTDATVHPGAKDTPYDGIDTDCVPDSDDVDGDGWDWPEDCDDDDATINPDATERCDGAVDEDCDGEVDEDADVIGSDSACPADDCLTIHSLRPAAGDGTYWISLADGPTELVCDMTNDYGGWTLVANFVWPGNTNGVAGWTSGNAVGTTTTDRTQSFKVSDADINGLVLYRYRGHGTATTCIQDDHVTVGACTVDTTLYWASSCVYASGSTSTGDCTAAYQTYDLDGWTELSNPCSWHYGLTSADCGVTSEFGTSHEGDHVFVGTVGTYIHAYDGRPSEDPNVEVWVR